MRHTRKTLNLASMAVALASLLAGSCAPAPEPTAIPLVDLFDRSAVENAQAPAAAPSRVEWQFDVEPSGPTTAQGHATGGWRAVHGITGLALRDGHLVGRAGETPMLAAAAPEGLDQEDLLHSIVLRLRVSEGTSLGVSFVSSEDLEAEKLITEARQNLLSDLNTELIPGPDFHTYTLTGANSSFSPSFPLSRIRHVIIRLIGAEAAEFDIVSVDLVSRKEHLASIPSGIGWQGLGEIYRETIVSRAPERISFEIDVPSEPYLDLALGVVESGPVVFRVEVRESGSASPAIEIMRRTVSTPGRWEKVSAKLDALAGRSVTLSLSLEAEQDGTIGYWGGPVIRNTAGGPHTIKSTPARAAVAGEAAPPPQGVILILADTLRRDHLDAYGYERVTSPVLTRLASEGVLFRDAIAQGTWTKVSAPSILTSLFPSTHGIVDLPDRLSASVTTLAEVYRNAGYATFATSSVPFTGKLTSLHQGVEVLHERASITDDDIPRSKTARIFVDRLMSWIEDHRDVPFFAVLHVFDPHSPYEPYSPYDTLWMDADAIAEHREQMKTLESFIEEDFMKRQGSLPSQGEIDASGIDAATYVEREHGWYDASIRLMDVEIGRLIERLQVMGLDQRTLIAFISDHGEEFLEHGWHFHGQSAYGELLNVPLVLRWPGVLPEGLVVEEMVQSIDLMPTLLSLSGLAGPEAMQGQSLLPLLADRGSRAAHDWRRRPAFAERAIATSDTRFTSLSKMQRESLAIINDGWKLIWNTERPEGWPEFELFDHPKDPLDLVNLADANPEIVQQLATKLESWHKVALAARISPEESTDGLSAEELNRLRSLGYVD